MGTRLVCTLSAVAMACSLGCGSDEGDAKKRAEELAAKVRAEQRGSGEVIEVAVPVKGNKRIECTDLITDMEAFNATMPNPVKMFQLDEVQQIKRQPGLNAVCEFIREGDPPTLEEQKKMAEKTQRLGTLPGDVYCELRVNCGHPEQVDYESKCRSMDGHQGNRDLGIFACVLVSQRAERDAYRFKFYEPDTGCYLDVLGGPSEVGVEVPQACAKQALEQITKSSIDKYRE